MTEGRGIRRQPTQQRKDISRTDDPTYQVLEADQTQRNLAPSRKSGGLNATQTRQTDRDANALPQDRSSDIPTCREATNNPRQRLGGSNRLMTCSKHSKTPNHPHQADRVTESRRIRQQPTLQYKKAHGTFHKQPQIKRAILEIQRITFASATAKRRG